MFIAIDLETTGLSAETDRIVEIGALRFDAHGRDLGSFQSLVNPRRPVGPGAFAVHGISDAVLREAPGPETVLPSLLRWIDETPEALLLAHNASFDAAFLGRELARLGTTREDLAIADTLAVARRAVPGVANYRLDTLADRFGLDLSGSHRALADCRRVMGIWLAMTAGVPPEPPPPRYPLRDAETPVPSGWSTMERAIAEGRRVRIEYAGGTRGEAPREISPSGFRHMGGVTYVVAQCHLDAQEKAFRLDRVRKHEIVETA